MKKYCLLLIVLVSISFAEQKITISYPRKDVTPEKVFTQETLEKSMNYLFSWQQAAGAFGELTLHSCWGEIGVVGRKYHGQYSSINRDHANTMLAMYEETGDYRWKLRAENIIANLMFLQAQSGGFYHAGAEHEPAYSEDKTCPIHQARPALGLLEYAEKPYADPELKKEIKKVLDKHWQWFNKHFYETGTRGTIDKPGWPWPCWCGVTNQDLVVIEALAMYGKVYGDMSRYEEFGKPALDVFLSDRYYYKGLGLFQRGDKPAWTFPERTLYYHVIFDSLKKIHDITGDERIPLILDDVCEQLFRATFVGEDGFRYFAHGVNVNVVDGKMEVVSYNKYPAVPGLIFSFTNFFDWYLERHPDPAKEKIKQELYRTAAAYIRADGTLPIALNPETDIFVLAPTNPTGFLLGMLKDKVKNFEIQPTPAIQRKYKDFVWYEKGQFYSIFKDGVREIAGYKLEPKGIVLGPDETMANVDFNNATKYGEDEKVFVEVMDITFDKEKTFTPAK